MTANYTDLHAGRPYPTDLTRRIHEGEVFVARDCMQSLGLLEDMRATSIAAIRQVAGDDVADSLQRDGLEYIHKYCPIEQIAEISNVIYELAERKAKHWVATIASDVFGLTKGYYFEKSPNIRFITPYDHMMEGREALDEFVRQHGGGKMTPHPPHRDSWVDCPDNVINVWIAIGPIPSGNGLTIFPDAFSRDLDHVASGSIAYQENPGEPTYIDLAQGDAILFHGEHLHASVLNHIETTRHVISFRIIDGKPHYPNGHYHHYLHSSLANGPLAFLAGVPANLAPGWLTTRIRFAAEKLGLVRPRSAPKNWKKQGVPADGRRSFSLSDLPVNSLKPVTESICVARVGDDRVVAFSRRCPHEGADFAHGTVHDGKIVCPWHNLPFDCDTGESPCTSLRSLRVYDTVVENGVVTIQTN